MDFEKMLECRVLSPELLTSLTQFFEEMGEQPFFHPHPFTEDEAVEKCEYTGFDLYYVLIDNSRILGYGMLRGWDEGYETPSLGIIIHPDFQGRGLGKLFVSFLHAAAKLRGAKDIILKVYPQNFGALQLYKSLGYIFEDTAGPQLKGKLVL
jgi:ribosomal protein S18 acetylase RimI-like enzyme